MNSEAEARDAMRLVRSAGTKHVFVDTNIHVATKFNYEHRRFRRLRELANAGLVHVHETTVDLGEIRSRIHAAAEVMADKLAEVQREGAILAHSQDANLRALVIPDRAGPIAGEMLQAFDRYRSAVGISTIPLSNTDNELVFARYFRDAPPFDEGKKKHEFPDAFIVATLERWCKTERTELYVVSSDGGVRNGASSTTELKPLRSLEEFLNLVVQEEHHDIAVRAFNWLSANRSNLERSFSGHFQGMGFYLEDYEGDVENIEVKEMRLSRPLLIEVTGDRLAFQVPAEVSYLADASYDDHNTGIYDSEEKELVFMDHRRVQLSLTTDVSIDFTLVLSVVDDPDASEQEPADAPESPFGEPKITDVRIEGERDIPVSIEEAEILEVYDSGDDPDDFEWYEPELEEPAAEEPEEPEMDEVQYD